MATAQPEPTDQPPPAAEDTWAGSVDYGEPSPTSPQHEDEDDDDSLEEGKVPQPESGGTVPKRAKTEVSGASHKDNTLRITAEEYPLVLTLMERSRSEMAFWEGLAKLYEESAGITRQEAPARRLQDMWPLKRAMQEEDQWQEKFFPVLLDPDEGMAPLITTEQVPNATFFLK